MEQHDIAEWSDERLAQETGRQLNWRESMPHAPERLAQIEQYITHLIFEIEYRSGLHGSE